MARRSPRLALVEPFRLPLGMLALAVAYGTVGYVLIEGWGGLDALYMTVTTLTTVGFREVHPLDRAGEIFTISVIVFGVSTVFVAIGTLSELVASGTLNRFLRRVRVKGRIDRLTDHYVICAFGRVGRAAAADFARAGVPYVVIDTDERLVEALEEVGCPYMIADPSKEQVLRDAGICRARGLVCAVDSDAVNVYITLTARALAPDITIVARASNRESVERLRRAGANRVVQPYALSGRQMATLSLRPAVVEFVDMVSVAPDVRLEEIEVHAASSLDGRSVGEVLAQHAGVMVLALKPAGGGLVSSPSHATVLGAGDLVVALGPIVALDALGA